MVVVVGGCSSGSLLGFGGVVVVVYLGVVGSRVLGLVGVIGYYGEFFGY